MRQITYMKPVHFKKDKHAVCSMQSIDAIVRGDINTRVTQVNHKGEIFNQKNKKCSIKR